VYDPFFVDVPKFLGMDSVNELYKIKDGSAWLAFERGECSEDELLRDFFLDRREWDGKGMVEMLNEEYRWLPGMEDIVRCLAAQGYEQHVLSNYPVWWTNIEEKLRISRYVKVGSIPLCWRTPATHARIPTSPSPSLCPRSEGWALQRGGR